MREAEKTPKEWYVLHDFRRFDWKAWQEHSQQARRHVLTEAREYLQRVEEVLDAPEGSSATYVVMGHKGDLMMLHLRPAIDDLLRLELEFEQTALAQLSERTFSYLSVTQPGLIRPTIPQWPYVSFHPTRSMPGSKGRNDLGEVQHMVTVSAGFDDWEWGVTLFGVDPLLIQKVVQEMRSDEVSVRDGLFGPVFFGVRCWPEEIGALLAGRLPTRSSSHFSSDTDSTL